MGRPRLALETHGDISVKARGQGYRARCLYRDIDGTTREVGRGGMTKGAAKQALQDALKTRKVNSGAAGLTGDSTINDLADLWFDETAARIADNTAKGYRGALVNHVRVAMGELLIREARTGHCDLLLKKVVANHGPDTASYVRIVLNGIFRYAIRLDILDRNPATGVTPIQKKRVKKRAMTMEQLQDARARIAADPIAMQKDIVDLNEFMMATGVRIGEACGARRQAFAFDDDGECWFSIQGTAVYKARHGTWFKPEPKTEAGFRRLLVPRWMVPALLVRCAGKGADDPIFPMVTKPGFRNPSDMSTAVSKAYNRAGYGWATSHTNRRTVITLMDKAGVALSDIRDWAGHIDPSTTTGYLGVEKEARAGRAVMEGVEELPSVRSIKSAKKKTSTAKAKPAITPRAAKATAKALDEARKRASGDDGGAYGVPFSDVS